MPARRSRSSACHRAALRRVLSRVDILLDRLDEFQATGNQLAAQQALVLLAELTEAETADLDARAPAPQRLTARASVSTPTTIEGLRDAERRPPRLVESAGSADHRVAIEDCAELGVELVARLVGLLGLVE